LASESRPVPPTVAFARDPSASPGQDHDAGEPPTDGCFETFGLVRRVERVLHPGGLAADGSEVLVVAFNRVGACREAIPGERKDDYPGTEADYVNEQRRVFYVSVARCRKTLVLSRALKVGRGQAQQLGLAIKPGFNPFWSIQLVHGNNAEGLE
jgi:hypothetical protein